MRNTQEVNAAIYDYYVEYYRDTLGLPDWERRAHNRMTEENIERIHMERLLRNVGPLKGKRVLNLGSGTGGFNLLAEKNGAACFGVDVSLDGVGISRDKFRLNGLPADRFVASAGEDLPFRSESFDLVYCLSVIEHVASVEATMGEVMRVLKPGGTFYLVAPNYLNFYESHYKIFWLPKFPKPLARFYLSMRGRPSSFVDTLNYITPGWLSRLLKKHSVSVHRFPQEISPGLSWKQKLSIRLREKVGLGHIEWAVTKTQDNSSAAARP